MTPTDLMARIAQTPRKAHRRLVALVGPPASGKSTLAEKLVSADPKWCVLPMDGFHLDNRVLDQRGLRTRKGAPQTFDAAGFQQMVQRAGQPGEVIYPLFDRSRDVSVNCAAVIGPEIDTVIVEGNYLLLNDPAWQGLHRMWDFSIMLDVAKDVLEQRLMQRWLDHGYSATDAQAKMLSNDMPNAELVLSHSAPPDIAIS